MARTMSASPLYGAVEAGGTKMVCAIGSAEHGSIERARIPTTDPDETIQSIIAFFRTAIAARGSIEALGIASFGPLDLDRTSISYGAVTTTPKTGWRGTNLPRQLGEALGVPAGINTDVNAAALAEARAGAAQGRDAVAYVTVGTGIGVGLISGGRMVQGLGHPEAGHLRLQRHPAHRDFQGVCPYHGDCLEGLASGPAIETAWGGSLDTLPKGHPAWDMEAHYLAHLCAALILTTAPEHIVLGGGVMSQHRLFSDIRSKTLALLGGYAAAWTPDAAAVRITPPGCAEPSGLVGAYLIAEQMRLRR
ncbi:MAG: ROK family protein [Sphingomonas sp.]|nr:ROK family protein [Sphingomonas sp.]